jgi:hypothetical protein
MSELPTHDKTVQVLLSVEDSSELERVAAHRGLFNVRGGA